MLLMYIQPCYRLHHSVSLWCQVPLLRFSLLLFFSCNSLPLPAFLEGCVNQGSVLCFFHRNTYVTWLLCHFLKRERDVDSRQVCCDGQRRLRFICSEWMMCEVRSDSEREKKNTEKKVFIRGSLSKVALYLRKWRLCFFHECVCEILRGRKR